MKKFLGLLSCLLFLSLALAARQTQVDTVFARSDSTSATAAPDTASKDTVVTNVNKPANAGTSCPCMDTGDVSGVVNWLFIFTPVFLFIFVLVLLLGSKGLSGFDFKGAMSENEIPRHTIINPEYSVTPRPVAPATGGIGSMIGGANSPANLNEVVPPTLDITIMPGVALAPAADYRPSISRFIAFFSGMLTVIIAVCMGSFFIYYYVRTSCPPDLSALSIVLIALGIGVAPYAINKITGAVASRKADD